MQSLVRKLARPQLARPLFRFASSSSATTGQRGEEARSATSYLLLAVPAVTFALGTWQVKRKGEKDAHIAHMEQKLSRGAQPLPLR